MDPYSSGEDLVIKTRKTYTITKQREKWTEEEHTLFLEALKLYGRAWQRIEEHVRTKTAVQIRSHAQKFFTKLEKETTVGQAPDIEIPPPRPKRKPSNPYPRKTGVAASLTQVGAMDRKIPNPISTSFQMKMTMTCDKGSEKLCDDVELRNRNEYCEKDKCFEVFNHLMNGPCAYPSLADKTSPTCDVPRKCTFGQYAPLVNGSGNQSRSVASLVTTEAMGLHVENSDNKQMFHDNVQLSRSMDSCLSREKSLHVQKVKELKQCGNYCKIPITDEQASQNYPHNVPVHILDGSFGRIAQQISADKSFTESALFGHIGGMHGDQIPFINPAGSATSEHYDDVSGSSIHQSSRYHPLFTPIQITDGCQSFLPISSTFSSSILSALTRNAAAFYAAASFAATLWPCLNMEAQIEPPTVSAGTFQSEASRTTPTMAAIAAATVAAATSWWAAQGLLPLNAPYHPGFTCSPASAPPTQLDGSSSGTINRDNKEETLDPALEGQQLEPGITDTQLSASKLQPSLSSDSEACAAEKLNCGSATPGTAEVENAAVLPDLNESKNKKQLDRSSCGSNTPSSSEVEADVMEKHADGEEENHTTTKDPEEYCAAHPIFDLFSRRCRNSSNINDSWKEVSEGGRLAFQALFSREVLPQSFSLHDAKNKGKKCSNQLIEEKVDDELKLELDGKRWITGFQKQEMGSSFSLIGGNKLEGLPNSGLEHMKLKTRRIGFKPYKRCSTEAIDRVSANSLEDEKDPKKLRIEGEASI